MWKSGIKAPCYCDCRALNAHPVERGIVADALLESFCVAFPKAQCVVSLADAGIPWGSRVADHLGLPFAYVKTAAKHHGVGGPVQCSPPRGAEAVIVDDLVASGGSIKKAIAAIQAEAGIRVVGVQSIVNWNFLAMRQAFDGLKDRCVTSYPQIVASALAYGHIDNEGQNQLLAFYKPRSSKCGPTHSAGGLVVYDHTIFDFDGVIADTLTLARATALPLLGQGWIGVSRKPA